MSARVTGPIVQALETTWAHIRRQHPDLPAVAITLGDGSGSRGNNKWGHFHASQWEQGGTDLHEVFMAGQRLKGGPEDMLETLLHEAAHALCHVQGIQDTSRQGRYHNARYKAMAETMGLEVSKEQGIGWSGTALTEQAKRTYRADIERIHKATTAHRKAFSGKAASGRTSSNNGVSAECLCGRKLRMSNSAWEQGPVFCAICTEKFEVAE